VMVGDIRRCGGEEQLLAQLGGFARCEATK
jgi:hypothetical protein